MERVADVIQAIADKLGVAAVHLWPEMVRYTWATAATWLVFTTVSVVFAMVLIPNRILHCRKMLNDNSFDSDAAALDVTCWCIIMALVGLVALIMITNIPDNLSKVLAPEGATVMQMLKATAGK